MAGSLVVAGRLGLAAVPAVVGVVLVLADGRRGAGGRVSCLLPGVRWARRGGMAGGARMRLLLGIVERAVYRRARDDTMSRM